MANTFKRKVQADCLAAGSLIYTVPASTTAVVIGFIITNKHTAEVLVTADTAGVQLLGTDTKIPTGSALSALDGKIVLETGDTVTVTPDADNQVDTILSVMEIT